MRYKLVLCKSPRRGELVCTYCSEGKEFCFPEKKGQDCFLHTVHIKVSFCDGEYQISFSRTEKTINLEVQEKYSPEDLKKIIKIIEENISTLHTHVAITHEEVEVELVA